jgi:N-acetylglucosamine transport system permease protein
MLSDQIFWKALSHNLLYLLTLPVTILAIALFFAFLFTQGIRGAGFFRITFFFPQVISLVAVGVLWSFIYHPTIGILNALLKLVGLGGFTRAWLGDVNLVLPAVGTVVVWHAVGFYMVLLIAAMQTVPGEFYEAARLDGASAWQLFRHVTFPLLWDTVQVAFVFLAIGALDMFAITQTMLIEGGPSRAGEVLATYLFRVAFVQSGFGYATAIAVTLFGIKLVISVATLIATRRERLEY